MSNTIPIPIIDKVSFSGPIEKIKIKIEIKKNVINVKNIMKST